jgi:hypothetical protein
MITLPFYIDLPLGFNFDGEVRGYVTTDNGSSHPYFKVMVIKPLGGWWNSPTSMFSQWMRDTFDLIADQASQHPDILPEAMRIEGWINGQPPVDHEAFREAAE